MKSLKVIGKDVFKKLLPKIVRPGFKQETKFFDHTLDIDRRVDNLYSNITRRFREEHPSLKPNGIAINFVVWGMELGIVSIRLVVVAENNSSDNRMLRKDLTQLISECPRIRKTGYTPTHVIVKITAGGHNWEHQQHEIYYLDKFQSEEILNKSRK